MKFDLIVLSGILGGDNEALLFFSDGDVLPTHGGQGTTRCCITGSPKCKGHRGKEINEFDVDRILVEGESRRDGSI